MKKQRKRIRKNKECPYCSFFKPCGSCAAKRENDPKYTGQKSVGTK